MLFWKLVNTVQSKTLCPFWLPAVRWFALHWQGTVK